MKIKSIIELLLGGVCGYFAFYFYLNSKQLVAIIFLVVLLLCIGLFIKSLMDINDPYNTEIKKLLKTYDSILVEIEILPKTSDKKIVKTKYFKDLVNVQYEVRKPIYYLKEDKGCTFIVMNDDTAYIYEVNNPDYIEKNIEE